MFTGIIEGMGRVTRIRPAGGGGRRIAVAADFPLTGTEIGDSISVNGVCLTAVTLDEASFEADLSPETLARSTFARVRVGTQVNLERAMRLSDRLDGHLVSGHIDGTATIRSRVPGGNAVVISYSAPPDLTRYMISKGSVAVDGISLTINDCGRNHFSVSIIPHTAHLTTVGLKPAGDSVNIETDLIGKYVERFVKGYHQPDRDKASGLDLALLQKTGFL
jgi:riboflavin synthase